MFPARHQIKLTNVSLVRMKKALRIACYKNKVLEWRSGVEKDLDNVLQIPNVFINVSKGQVANKEDLDQGVWQGPAARRHHPRDPEQGELQSEEKERNAQLERVHNEVVDIVAGRLVDPKTKRDLPRWSGVSNTKAMKALIAHQPNPVARARMRLRITCPTNILKQAAKAQRPHLPQRPPQKTTTRKARAAVKTTTKEQKAAAGTVENQDVLGDEWECVGFVEPGAYRALTEFISTQTKGAQELRCLTWPSCTKTRERDTKKRDGKVAA
ncbi:shwachman-Bodian-diamond syndrome protein-like protein [Phyllosticta capitalensis]